MQAAGYGLAAAAAAADQPTALVVAPAAVAIAAVTTMRPSAARVLPGIVRSSGELTVGNVGNGYCETSAALAGPAAGALLLAIGGAPAVLAGSAVAALLAVAVSLLPRPIHPMATAARSGRTRTIHVAADSIGELRRRPGALSVLAIAGSQFVVGAGRRWHHADPAWRQR